MKEKIKIGIVGFGTVGAGVAETLLKNNSVIAKRCGVELELTGIADLDIVTSRGVDLPSNILTTDVDKVIAEADIVVELVGGTTFAGELILKTLRAGKSVVTANKALLALRGKELFAAAESSGADIYYEASVAGGIPVIKALREGLSANRIKSIYGIMNGTCNYILTRMENEGASFESILDDAQKLGYAEADPSLDIDGFDTAHKTAILASLAYGEWFGVDNMYVEGIRDLSLDEVKNADELGYRIKLLGIIKDDGKGDVRMSVYPTLVPKSALLANISDVFNGVMIEGDVVGRTLFYGRGAGRQATASAVVSDIVDVALNLKSGALRRIAPFREAKIFDRVIDFNEIISRYYLRLKVVDCPGVIAAISEILAKYKISISSLIQHELHEEDGSVPLVILTHEARESSLNQAIAEIESLAVSCDRVRRLRIEDI